MLNKVGFITLPLNNSSKQHKNTFLLIPGQKVNHLPKSELVLLS